MQEIAPHVYMETAYAGVTLGAIAWTHGLVLIDAPFRAEDARSWRAALLNLGGGVDRMLVNLDAHPDRTLGSRAMDCTIVGQEKLIQVFRNRPVTFKPQSPETGAEWELYNGLGSIRWLPPEITFTHQLSIYWDGFPLMLEYRPGSAIGAVWATLPDQKIIFVGDSVVIRQPPFLSTADLPAWIDNLKFLLEPPQSNYTVVSGRDGLVTHQDLHHLLSLLERVHQKLETLAAQGASADEAERLTASFLKEFEADAQHRPQYDQRLRHGLRTYFTRRYQPASVDAEGE